MITLTPFAANARAVAAPKPVELAVTSATEGRVKAGILIEGRHW